MKKQFILIGLLLAVGSQLRAQYSDYYYHRVGDTIEWKANNGFYTWWEFKPYFQQNLKMYLGASYLFSGYFDSLVVLMEYYTPTPLKIIGVAGTGFRGRTIYDNFDVSNPDTNQFQEYYYVYDAHPSGMTLKVQQPWNSFVPGRTLHIKIHSVRGDTPEEGMNDTCCWYKPREYYLPLHEYYFDSAIYVTDSFYVGGSYFGNMPTSLTGDTSSDQIKTKYFYAITSSRHIPCAPELQNGPDCSFNGVHLRCKCSYNYRDDVSSSALPFEQQPWQDGSYPYGAVMLVYPIVEVDTTVPPADVCPPVANVETVVSGTTATVTWDDFPNYTHVELAYGPCNVPQSYWQTVEVADNTLYTLTGLNPGACYKVCIRAYCEADKDDTPWSTPLTFFTGTDTTDTHDTTGIQTSILSQLTFLVPNPASTKVTVSSSFSLQEVDIWNVDGIWVHHQSVSGHQATIDVSVLRPGTYIVAIRTHNGTTHKRLVISR